MVIPSRKIGERLLIEDQIVVQVVEVNGRRVRLGIDAPAEVPIWREEMIRKDESLAKPDCSRVDGRSIGKEGVMPAESNPLAEAMARAHAKLLSDLGELAHAIRTSSHTSLKELRARLERARTDLTEHFRLEEQDGYMDAVKGRSPSQYRAIERLLGEHQELLKSLDGIMTLASRSATFSDRLRNKTLLWIERVHAHEHQENELMQDALGNGIAAED